MMRPPTIVCPQCYALILKAERCSKCGWSRLAPHQQGQMIRKTTLRHPLGTEKIQPGLYQDWLCFPGVDGFLETIYGKTERSGGQVELPEAMRNRLVTGISAGFLVTTQSTQLLKKNDKPRSAFLVYDHHLVNSVVSIPSQAASLSAPALSENAVYYYDSDHVLTRVDIHNFEITRQVRLPEDCGWSHAAPLVKGDIVCLSGGNTGLAAAVQQDRILWTRMLPYSSPYTPLLINNHLCLVIGLRYLYLLDPASGKPLDEKPLRLADFITAPPVAFENLIILAVEDENKNKLVAYSLKSGRLEWHFDGLSAQVVNKCLVKDGMVYCADENGVVYAVDARSGGLCWKFETHNSIVTVPVLIQDTLIVGSSSGELWFLSTQESCAEGWELRPLDECLERKDWASAAVHLALQKDYSLAAEYYLRAGMAVEAAVLFRESNQVEQALHVCELENLLDIAEPLLLRQKSYARLLKLYESNRRYSQAALLLEELKRFDEAADFWKKEQDYGKAAMAYLRSCHPEEAGKLVGKVEDIAIQMSVLIQAGNMAEVARLLEKRKQFDLAIEWYLKAELPQEALRLAENQQDWAKVAQIALQLRLHEKAANALRKRGDFEVAAREYAEAAVELEGQLKKDTCSERAANLYQLALECYSKIEEADPDLEAELRVKMEWHRRLARLLVQVSAPKKILVKGDNSSVEVKMTNTGWGRAKHIQASVSELFRPSKSPGAALLCETLQPGQSWSGEIAIQPQTSEVGDYVQFEIIIDYINLQGTPCQKRVNAHAVVARDAAHARELRKRLDLGNPSIVQVIKPEGQVNIGSTVDNRHDYDEANIFHGKETPEKAEPGEKRYCNYCKLDITNFVQDGKCPRCFKPIKSADN